MRAGRDATDRLPTGRRPPPHACTPGGIPIDPWRPDNPA
jgi:hypothetical protein